MHQDRAIDLVIALRIAEVFDIDCRRFWMLRYWLRKNCGDRGAPELWSLYSHGRRLDGKDALPVDEYSTRSVRTIWLIRSFA